MGCTSELKRLEVLTFRGALEYASRLEIMIMIKQFLHIPEYSKRHVAGAVLTAIFMIIVLSPLAPLAMHSKSVIPARAGECSGDCNICGCSPESRSAGTCCCSKKRAQQARAHKEEEQAVLPDCCKKKPVERKVVIASCGCPCGSGKTAMLTGSAADEVLPFYFMEQFAQSPALTDYFNLITPLVSNHIKPPVPPPQLV
ncbi:MAG: hypothetical protein PHY09_07900 [Desulfuromonadaceae bacterium]|nr:hypothetical protein [Desulfuromonadaceae bacterium]